MRKITSSPVHPLKILGRKLKVYFPEAAYDYDVSPYPQAPAYLDISYRKRFVTLSYHPDAGFAFRMMDETGWESDQQTLKFPDLVLERIREFLKDQTP